MHNISIKKYRSLNNTKQYDLVLRNLNPKNEFNGVVFNENTVTYKEVRLIIKMLKSGNKWSDLYEVFNIMYNVSEDVFYYSNITDYYACRNYIYKYISDLQKRETKLLQSISADAELWKAAGGNRLDKYSDITPLVQLGEFFGIYPFDLENKYYSEILVLLAFLKDKREVQTSFDNLKRRTK